VCIDRLEEKVKGRECDYGGKRGVLGEMMWRGGRGGAGFDLLGL
jgi:hypothetical protein